jgi:hypothetical protein
MVQECFVAKKSFFEYIKGELFDILGEYKEDSVGTDVFRHKDDIRIKWTLPKGVNIRACFRPCVGKNSFDDGITIVCCQLAANIQEMYLAYVRNTNGDKWYKLTRFYSDSFNDIDDASKSGNATWCYGREKLDTSILLTWIKSCDVVFKRDYAEEIKTCGNWILSADSRNNQKQDISKLRNIINMTPFNSDPVIHYWLDKFLEEAIYSTPRSTNRDSHSLRASGYLMKLMSEVQENKWQTESKEMREEKKVQLFTSE